MQRDRNFRPLISAARPFPCCSADALPFAALAGTAKILENASRSDFRTPDTLASRHPCRAR